MREQRSLGKKWCTKRSGISNGRPPGRTHLRRLLLEPLEGRCLLSGGTTLADLPVAAQTAVSAAIGQDQSAYHATDPFVREAKPTASDGAAYDYFGASVAVGGNTMVVGADQATVGGNAGQGAVYVFTESGAAWTQTAKLTASGGAAGDQFGQSVAISGNTVVVGASGANSYQGAAYVFTASGAAWTQTAKLTASDGAADAYFGQSVAISDGTVVVGALYAQVGENALQGAAYVFTASGAAWTQTAKLTASDGAAYAYFGTSVAIGGNGDTVAVGASGANDRQGTAYVFTAAGAAWTQTAELTASDGAANAYFGSSVALSGSTMVVGALYATAGGNFEQGAAYVFTASGAAWTQAAELTATNGAAYAYFGSSVALSGNTLMIGAPDAAVGGNVNQGAAYVFTASGAAWTQTAELTAFDGAANAYFGQSVSISGNTFVVGAPEATVGGNYTQGAAYVFGSSAGVTGISPAYGPLAGGTTVTITGAGFQNATAVDFGTVAASSFTIDSDSQITATSPAGSGTVDVTVVFPAGTSVAFPGDQFTYTADLKFTASDGAAAGQFGAAISISGDTMAVGAPGAAVDGHSDQGAVYVFTKSGAAWNQTAELTASDGAAYADFGQSVSISGNTLVIGAPNATVGGKSYQGAAYVFTASGAAWTQTAELAASDGAASNFFGNSVAITGNTLVVGANGANSYQGAAYVFTASGAAWPQTAELTASDAAAYAAFASSVSISGGTIAVGAPGGDGGRGTVYVFAASGAAWPQTAELTASDAAAYAAFGSSVSISGGIMVAGCAWASSNQGAAYLFTESGAAWTQSAEFTASDAATGAAFGNSVSISGNTVVVGADEATVGGNGQQGAAYVFMGSGAAWIQTAEPTAFDGAAGNAFASSVSVSGSTLAVGAPNAAVNGNNGQGAAYLLGLSTAPVVTAVSPAAGLAAGGASVTITGAGFLGATAVDFGAAAASNVVINSAGTQITATSPAGIGTVDVTVTGPAGVSAASLADKFTYASTDGLGVYSGGVWYIHVNGTTKLAGVPASWAGATPVTGDWNGTGKTEIGLFDSTTDTWWLNTAGDGIFKSSETFTFGFGGSDVVPVVGDWNGAGKTEVGLYSDGAWFRDVDGSHTWDAANQAALAYLGWTPVGTRTVVPVPGDWAGDGKTEMGVYCNGAWFLDSTGSGKWDGGFAYWGWNNPALVPVAGNWSSSGTKSQFGVYSQGAWFLDYDNSHTWDAANQAAVTYYGWSGAQPVVGNWGSGFVGAARRAASGVQTPVSTSAQLPPAATRPALALPSALFLAADTPGRDSGPQSGNAVQPDAGPAGSAQLADPASPGNAPLESTPQTTQLSALDPQAVDGIDLSAVVEDALSSEVGRLNIPSG